MEVKGYTYQSQPGQQPVYYQPGQPPAPGFQNYPGAQPVFYQAQPGAVQMQFPPPPPPPGNYYPGQQQPGIVGYYQPPSSQQPPVVQQIQPQQQLASGQHHSNTQQQQMPWMQVPSSSIAGCPPGLEYLTALDQLLVNQVVEMFEIFSGWETENRYRIFNTMGQQAYYAFEKSNGCSRQFCGHLRGFDIHIVDNANNEVMTVHRPFKYTCCGFCGCCLGCQQEIRVEAPPGTPIGYAIQEQYCCSPSFVVMDAARTPVFRVQGPNCVGCMDCGQVGFKIVSASGGGAQVGKISKQWSGFWQEMYTDADNFGISFPMDLDVRLKATLLGVLFLIDFMFFEDSGNNDH